MSMEFPKAAWRAAGITAETDCALSAHTTFRIGGSADCLLTGGTAAQIQQVIADCSRLGIPLTVIGGGSNVLVSDDGIRGVTLCVGLTPDTPPVTVEEGYLTAPAGCPLKRLCSAARDGALSGLEFAYGIPGTVGGAVYMNAGAYQGETASVLAWVDVVTPDGRCERLSAADLAMGYRHTALMENGCVVTRAAFALTAGDRETIDRTMHELMERRRQKQPLAYPSAGSYFKRPSGQFAGALIEASGLKGTTVGGAQVSEKHAGFIINRGGATCRDVLRLERLVEETVFNDHGVRLEREVRYLGSENGEGKDV